MRSGAVRVEMPQVGGREAAFLERVSHGAHHAFARRVGGRHMVGVAGRSEAGDLRQGLGAARERMLKRLEDHRSGALARNEPAAIEVERARRARRVLLAGKRAQVGETGDADGVHAFLGAARKRHVGIAVTDVAHSLADAVGARSARGDDVHALALHAVADGEVARGDVADHRGHEQRVHALGALLEQRLKAAFEFIDTADAAAEHHGHARGVLVVHGKPRLGDCLVGGDDGVLHEALEPAALLLREAVLGGVEARDLAGVVHLVIARVEALDGADAAFAAHDGAPKGLHPHAGRRDRAHAGDDDTMRPVGSARGRIRFTHSAIPPSMQIT